MSAPQRAPPHKRPAWSTPARCALLAIVLMGTLHLLRRRIGFMFTDEGYLWYGVLAVLRGELPLRDFNSYDPGRYFWCAAWAHVLGPGLLALRLSRALFAVVGLFFGLLVAQRVLGRRWLLVLAGLVLVLWMQPSWKVFESALALTAVWVGTRLIESPSLRSHAFAGAFVGLAAFFGRNHGVYASAGLLVLIVVVAVRTRPRTLPRRLTVWGGGVIVGYLPMLALVAFAPGFAEAFIESIGYFAQQGQLSGKAAIPWPWRVDYGALDAWGDVHGLAVGLAFLLLPLVYLPSLIALVAGRARDHAQRAPWMAATAIGIPYVHHTLVHADFYHLAQAIDPLLLSILALPAGLGVRRALLSRITVVSLLLALTLAAVVPVLEPVDRLRRRGTPVALRPLEVGGEEVLVDPSVGLYLELLAEAVESNVAPHEAVFLAPTFPGLYCLLERTAPTWDVYLVWRGTEASQARLLRELKEVEWVLVADIAPWGQEWMRLANTNPRAWTLLERDFESFPVQSRLPRRHVLRRRRPEPGRTETGGGR